MDRVRPTVVAGALILAMAGIVGCPGHRGAPDGWVPSSDSGISDGQRFEAMLSVHAHARWPDGDFDGFPFMDLGEAISILSRDKGPAADSRRRRAIAKLAGYGLERREFQRAIEELGVSVHDLQDVLTSVLTRLPPHPPPAAIELALLNSDLLQAQTKQCKFIARKMQGGVFTSPAPTFGWDYDYLVPRPMDSIARSLDAQSWDQCPGYFTYSYLVKTPGCCPKTATTTCDSDCTYDLEPGTSRPKETTKAPGRPYDDTIYEHFCLGVNCGSCESLDCLTDFENLLCVKTGYDIKTPFPWLTAFADRYDLTYGLACPMRGEIVGNDEQVDVDFGQLSARRLTAAEKQTYGVNVFFDWSWVHADKTIAFKGATSGAVGKYLKAKQDELGGMVAELACCRVERKCSLWWL